jgi:hypothetical protein
MAVTAAGGTAAGGVTTTGGNVCAGEGRTSLADGSGLDVDPAGREGVGAGQYSHTTIVASTATALDASRSVRPPLDRPDR